MNLEDLVSSLKKIRLLIGEKDFEEAFLRELESLFKPEEIYLLSLRDPNVEGFKFERSEIKKVSYSILEFDETFNLNFNKIQKAKEELLEEESLGLSQKILVFFPEGQTVVLILKNVKKTELLIHLKIIAEILAVVLHSHYYVKKAKEKDIRNISESLAVLAHEIKNPLTTIKTGIELLLSDNLGEEERRKILETINATIIELTEEIDNLSYKAFKEKESFEKVNIAELFSEIIEEVKPLSINKKVEIIIKPKEVAISGNKFNLKKAFLNLIINAIKYNREGGKVFIEVDEKGGKVLIKIRDTGIGIPKEIQEKIFEKGFRGSHEGISGTGFGLYIVKKIVEAHQGKIKVKSEPGEGSEFTVILSKEIKSYKPFYFVFAIIILIILVLLNIYPLIPYKPELKQLPEMIAYKTISDSLIRIKTTESEYDCSFRKTLFTKKDKVICEMKKGEINTDLKKTHMEIKTPFINLKNIGTSFDLFVTDKTGLSVFEGTLAGKNTSFKEGQGAIIQKDIKILPLLEAVKEVKAQNLENGALEISWKEIIGAKEYEVIVSEDQEFFKIVKVLKTKEPKIVLNLPKDGYYYVRIYAIDKEGLKGFPATKQIVNFYHLTLGRKLRENERFDEAIKEFEKSYEDFNKKEVLPLSEIAWTYYIKGDFAKAEIKYKEAFKVKRRIEDLNRLARIYYHQDRLSEAKALYNEVLNKDSQNLDALWGLAEVFVKEKNLIQAERYLERVKSLDNTYPLLHYTYARLYLLKGQKERAIEELKLELKIHPNSYETKQLLSEILTK